MVLAQTWWWPSQIKSGLLANYASCSRRSQSYIFMATTGGILGASLAPVSGFDLSEKGLRASAYASLTAMHGHTRAD